MNANPMYLETDLMNTKKKRKLVFGYGVNDWEYRSYFNGKPVWQYRLWSGVLERCCSEKFKLKKPEYANVKCNKQWLSLKNFIEDIVKVENYEKFYLEKWHIDKDILIKNNKLYSTETVCFVPHEVNCLLTKSNSSRGENYIGVHFNKRQGKYTAHVNDGSGNKIHLGVFSDPESAFYAYKTAKESIIKATAEKWKGVIANNVYNALMNYEVEIND